MSKWYIVKKRQKDLWQPANSIVVNYDIQHVDTLLYKKKKVSGSIIVAHISLPSSPSLPHFPSFPALPQNNPIVMMLERKMTGLNKDSFSTTGILPPQLALVFKQKKFLD